MASSPEASFKIKHYHALISGAHLGIDQHARQLTISLRNEQGDVIQARQVSTRPEKIQAFFAKLTRECVERGEGFVAILEVGGFNDWLIKMLGDYRCRKVILIQPEERNRLKTDRRDAALSELLWVNRCHRAHASSHAQCKYFVMRDAVSRAPAT